MVSSSIFKVFGMTRPGIEPRSPGPLANTLTAGPMSRLIYISSCRATSMDLPEPLQQPVSIIHRSQLVFNATPCIGTEMLHIGSSWSSCLCSSMWSGQHEYVTYEFVPTSPSVSCMSGSSNLDSFRDSWYVAVQLLLCVVLLPGLGQYCSLHSCAYIYIYIYI